jgi:hypothetical protein
MLHDLGLIEFSACVIGWDPYGMTKRDEGAINNMLEVWHVVVFAV